jgi:hypothetical protein
MAAAALVRIGRRAGVAARRPPAACASSAARAGDGGPREDVAFWDDMYQRGADVFTLPEVNENLVQFLDELLPGWPPAPGGTRAVVPAVPSSTTNTTSARAPVVLVPACGRDVSMLWLAARGVDVIGVDFALEPLVRLAGGPAGLERLERLRPAAAAGGAAAAAVYRLRRAPRVTLIHADLLTMSVPDDLGVPGGVDGVWDRGALTAVPPGSVPAYAARVAAALRPGGRVLCEILASNVPVGNGVDEAGVGRALVGAGLSPPEVVGQVDVRGAYPGFSPPGLSRLDEVVLVAGKPAGGGATAHMR